MWAPAMRTSSSTPVSTAVRTWAAVSRASTAATPGTHAEASSSARRESASLVVAPISRAASETLARRASLARRVSVRRAALRAGRAALEPHAPEAANASPGCAWHVAPKRARVSLGLGKRSLAETAEPGSAFATRVADGASGARVPVRGNAPPARRTPVSAETAERAAEPATSPAAGISSGHATARACAPPAPPMFAARARRKRARRLVPGAAAIRARAPPSTNVLLDAPLATTGAR